MKQKEKLILAGEVIVVRENMITGEKKRFVTRNLITNDGDIFYAHKAFGSDYWTPGFFRMGSDPASADVAKSDTDVNSFLATTNQAIDGGYPKADDDDADNVSSLDILTWRCSYGTGAANVNSISEIAICDSSTSPSKALCHAVFATPFAKTSDDTLKVFVNHEFLGG